MHEYGVRGVGEIQEVPRDNLGIGKRRDPKVAFVNTNQQIKKETSHFMISSSTAELLSSIERLLSLLKN